jgi:hypothetical protein
VGAPKIAQRVIPYLRQLRPNRYDWQANHDIVPALSLKRERPSGDQIKFLVAHLTRSIYKRRYRAKPHCPLGIVASDGADEPQN